MSNPCVGCGACCASFRVEFYWREANAEDSDHPVPPGLYEELSAAGSLRCMKGTNLKHHPKCVGLTGRIGRDASCSIYESRPSPCRAFTASYFNGKHNPRCDAARARHGLSPLTRDDWGLVNVEREI